MKVSSLTNKGISTTVDSRSVPVILQVINLQPEVKELEENKKAFISEISDGFTKLRCYWGSCLFDRITALGDKFNGSIVKVTEYVATTKKILVSEFEILYLFDETIGNPVAYKDYLANRLGDHATNEIDLAKVVKFKEEVPHKPESRPSGESERTDYTPTKTEKENKSQNLSTPSKMMDRLRIKEQTQYQMIEDLYPSMEGWTLNCRIAKLNFRDFENRKGGKTQLLEFEMRDTQSWTVKGVVFGAHAVRLSKELVEGEVYTFERGSVKVDTYSTPGSAKCSPYTITFSEYSRINLSSSSEDIKKEGNYKRISDIRDWKVNAEIDVACIVKEVKQEETLVAKNSKDGGQLTKRVFVVCDPLEQTEVEITLWRERIGMVDPSFERKTVGLENFKVTEYNGKLSLSGTIKSRIVPLKNHALNEVNVSAPFKDFASLSYQKGDSDSTKSFSTARQLLEASEGLKEGDKLWSTLRVYVSRIRDSGKKWYCGCPSPSCKKTLEETDTVCHHCSAKVAQPCFRYILGIHLSDVFGTGSLWASAYDDFATRIFNLPAEQARKLTEEKFVEKSKRCLFQEFKVTILSKVEYTPDFNRRVKHNVTQFQKVDPAKEAKSNLAKIQKLVE